MQLDVQFLQELDRFEVLPAAVAVGDPLAALTRVVEVQHAGDRVDPQPVDVVLVEPEPGRTDEELPHLLAAVIEDQRVPVRVVPLPRVGVLVQAGPVEPGQAVGVGGEVGRHPVDDDPQPPPVQFVHEVHEVVRGPEPAGRGEVAGRLVAPTAVERVLGDRHQLHVGEAVLDAVVADLLGELVVGQVLPPVLGPPPTAQVHLVNGDGGAEPVGFAAAGDPGVVAPVVAGQVPGDAGGLRGPLVVEGDRVALLQRLAGGGADGELVAVAVPESGHVAAPHAGRAAPQFVGPRGPAVPVADDRDGAGVGGPDPEPHAAGPVPLFGVGPEVLVLIHAGDRPRFAVARPRSPVGNRAAGRAGGRRQTRMASVTETPRRGRGDPSRTRLGPAIGPARDTAPPGRARCGRGSGGLCEGRVSRHLQVTAAPGHTAPAPGSPRAASVPPRCCGAPHRGGGCGRTSSGRRPACRGSARSPPARPVLR